MWTVVSVSYKNPSPQVDIANKLTMQNTAYTTIYSILIKIYFALTTYNVKSFVLISLLLVMSIHSFAISQ